jgi:transposase-like protein
MRKRYSAKFKAEVVQEVLQEHKAIAEIASEHGVHPNQIYRWKEIALQGLPSLFTDDAQAAKAAAAEQEKQLDELYAQIGRLTTQLHWLEKKSGLDAQPG